MTKTLALAAAASLLASSAAFAECSWGTKDAYAMTKMPAQTAMSEPVEVAQAPLDTWVVKYLDEQKKV